MIRKLLLIPSCCALVALFTLTAKPAHADTQPESSFWFMSLSRARLGERVQSFLDIQPRTNYQAGKVGADGDLRQLLLRGAIGYDLTDNLTLFQGYATIAGYEPVRVEHRSFQELLGRQKFSRFSLLHRVRFEQRLLEDVSGVSLRGRYFLRLQKPISENYSLVSNEEAFFHLNDRSGGPQAGFDQNRLFLGVNRKITRDVSVDLGYQLQYIERRGGADDAVNHILFLGILSSFDFS